MCTQTIKHLIGNLLWCQWRNLWGRWSDLLFLLLSKQNISGKISPIDIHIYVHYLLTLGGLVAMPYILAKKLWYEAEEENVWIWGISLSRPTIEIDFLSSLTSSPHVN